MTHHPIRRAGFTLIELLVVLGIMGLLTALTAGAVARYRQSAMEKDTDLELRKIQLALDQQWKAATDQIRNEDLPQNVMNATKNADGSFDPIRARAFHMKMRLRQEFPQSFPEVLALPPLPGGGYAYTPVPGYVKALQNVALAQPEETQSAALLMLVLSRGRGGATFDPTSVGPTAVLNCATTTGGTIPLRVFVDAWGQPIGFRRVADDARLADVIPELNRPPFAQPGGSSSGSTDPQDPEGRLRNPTWPGRATLMSVLAQTDPAVQPFIQNPFDGLNRGPYAFSAGRDRVYGNEDDLYSFRIQQSGKGN